ncbi:MAG: hypothetical protein ABSF34_18685, partial [Verrucomicrobiota bacterium]
MKSPCRPSFRVAYAQPVKSMIAACMMIALPMLAINLQAQNITNIFWQSANNPTQPSDGLWSDPANWNPVRVPTTNDSVIFDSTGQVPCTINATAAICWHMNIGQDGTGSVGTLIITNGGTFSAIGDYCSVGYSGTGTLDVESGSSATFVSHLWIGFNSGAVGTFIMNGGTVTVSGNYGLGWNGGAGHAHINGGTLNLSQFDGGSGTEDVAINNSSSMDIAGGTVLINGNASTAVKGYVTAGKLTAYGGAGTVIMDYNNLHPGKTTVLAINT